MVRLYVNYFQPSFKLLSKTRDGAKSRSGITSRRPLANVSWLTPRSRPRPRKPSGREFAPLDPVELLHQIREGQAALAALGSGDLSHGPERQSLEEFLAKLPELWREGKLVRPIGVRPRHTAIWRTRKDPFEEVWPEILLWLQNDPDSTAKSLMERLQQQYPGRFPEVQLRTLQRRIRDWRAGDGPDPGARLPGWQASDREPGRCRYGDEWLRRGQMPWVPPRAVWLPRGAPAPGEKPSTPGRCW